MSRITISDFVSNAIFGSLYGYLAAVLFGIESKLLAVFVLAAYWTLTMLVYKLNVAIRSEREIVNWKNEYMRFGIIAWLALLGVLAGVAIARADFVLSAVAIIIVVLVALATYGLIKRYGD